MIIIIIIMIIIIIVTIIIIFYIAIIIIVIIVIVIVIIVVRIQFRQPIFNLYLSLCVCLSVCPTTFFNYCLPFSLFIEFLCGCSVEMKR